MQKNWYNIFFNIKRNFTISHSCKILCKISTSNGSNFWNVCLMFAKRRMRKENDGKEIVALLHSLEKKKSLSILVILFSSCFFLVKIKWNHIVFLLKPNEITRIDYYNNWNYIHVYSISKRFNFCTKNNSFFFFMPWLNGNRIIMSYSICIKNWKMYVIENLHARTIIWIFIYVLI